MALSNLTKVQTLGIGSNIEVVGVITTGQFKSGTSNLHSTGVDLTNLNVSGIATIGGNVSIGGTLTYQDVTNIDSVGLITARAGVNVSGGQLDVGSNIKLGSAGVVTATSLDISGDIDVDGHTNLDNVSIVGVTTFNGLSTNDVIRVRAADTNGISVINILAEGTTGHSRIKFSDTAGTDGQISYTHTDRALTFAAGGTTETLRLDSSGRIIQNNAALPSVSSNLPYAYFAPTKQNYGGVDLTMNLHDDASNALGNGGGIGFSANNASGSPVVRGAIRGNTEATNSTAGYLSFFTRPASGNSTERLRITSTGLVGIATNSPSAALLDIATDQGSNDHLRLRRLSSDSNVATNWSLKPYAGNLYFRTGGSTDKIYFDDSGDINVMDGNLVIATAGHGIDFSATPNGYAGSINETLDDYEEGYFTPTVGGWSASGTGVYGSGGQRGRYTKVGNLVTVFFHVYWTALNNASGVFAIENLPFAHSSSTYNLSTAVQMRYVDYSGDTVYAVGGNGYSSSLLFYAQNDNGNHNYVPIDSNGGRIEGTVTYLTDS